MMVIATNIFEFATWYKFGYKTVPKSLIIDLADPDLTGEALLTKTSYFEEEYEVFYLQVKKSVYLQVKKSVFVTNNELIHLSLYDVDALIPLSENGARLLSTKIADFRLAAPLEKQLYEKLLDAFWRNIDPTQKDAQFCDHGTQYRSAVFYHNDEQRRAVEASRTALAGNKPFKGEIVTQIAKADIFYPAEGYHQDYHQKNPVRYQFYKSGCGREARLKELWGSRPK